MKIEDLGKKVKDCNCSLCYQQELREHLNVGKKPFTCPNCWGLGIKALPNNGQGYGTTKCHSCKGEGIVWG